MYVFEIVEKYLGMYIEMAKTFKETLHKKITKLSTKKLPKYVSPALKEMPRSQLKAIIWIMQPNGKRS